MYYEQDNIDRAVQCYVKSFEIYTISLGPNHVDTAEVSNKLGKVLLVLGRFSEAEQYILRAHQIFLHNLGEHHRNTSMALLNLGILYASKRCHKRAFEVYYHVLKDQQVTFNGEAHSDLGFTLHCIASAYEGAFKLDKAIKYYREELLVLRTSLHPYHLDIAKLLHHMAMLVMNKVDSNGDYLMLNDCIEWLEESANIYQHHHTSNMFYEEVIHLKSCILQLRKRQYQQMASR